MTEDGMRQPFAGGIRQHGKCSRNVVKEARMPEYVPKTVYVTYIGAPPEKVWAALTDPACTRQYFFGRAVELEPKVGGSFILRMPDGRVDVRGRVVACDPHRLLSVTWRVEWIEEMRKLPECLVTYRIEALDGAVRLTMT